MGSQIGLNNAVLAIGTAVSLLIASPAQTFGLDKATAAKQENATQSVGGWRLVHAENPQGGKASFAITRSADISKSDTDLAGLMIRCGSDRYEVLVVLLVSFSPRTRPLVNIAVGGKELSLEATVVTPFTALLLPHQARELIDEAALAQERELSVDVGGAQNTVHGAIPLDRLSAGLDLLNASCLSAQ
jgi:hypothetical protein